MKTIVLPGYSTPVLIRSITWLKGEGSYTRVNFQDKSYSTITQPLVWFEHHLDFIRISRSIMVNQAYVTSFYHVSNRSGEIHLLEGPILPVSRSRIDYLTAILNSKLDGHSFADSSIIQI